MKFVFALALTLATSSMAKAENQVLECENNHRQRAEIEIVPTQDKSLAVWKLTLQSGDIEYRAFLTARISDDHIHAQGKMYSYNDTGPILEPNDLLIQGNVLDDGRLSLGFYDENRVIQKGFGLHLICE